MPSKEDQILFGNNDLFDADATRVPKEWLKGIIMKDACE